MILFLLAYFGGALTIVSPCILPVLPFVFARSERPFVRSGLPMLAGMAATFAAVATLAAVGGGWAVQANQYGRAAALAMLALFGTALLVPALSDRLTRPLVALGARLATSAGQGAQEGRMAVLPALLLGVATGLLWAPCAGPGTGADPDGGRPAGRKLPDLAVARHLCGRSGDVAGGCPFDWGTLIRGNEALASRRRMDTPRPRRGDRCLCRRHRARSRYRIADPRIPCQHGFSRTGPARPSPCDRDDATATGDDDGRGDGRPR